MSDEKKSPAAGAARFFAAAQGDNDAGNAGMGEKRATPEDNPLVTHFPIPVIGSLW